MKISASDVAKYVIKVFQECEDPITNLKLQKLLYYIQGWHLGLYDAPVFDDDFQAWIHGPVIPKVFYEYKDEFPWLPIINQLDAVSLPLEIELHIEEVLTIYGKDSCWELELRIHKEDPWLIARKGVLSHDECFNEISKEELRRFFQI